MTTRSRSNIHCPRGHTDDTIPWPSSKPSLFLTTTIDNHLSSTQSVPEEPSSFTEASKHPEWRTTMNIEFQAPLQNHTWDLVLPSSQFNVLGSKWILKTKRRADGSLKCYKARLVANGSINNLAWTSSKPSVQL